MAFDARLGAEFEFLQAIRSVADILAIGAGRQFGLVAVGKRHLESQFEVLVCRSNSRQGQNGERRP